MDKQRFILKVNTQIENDKDKILAYEILKEVATKFNGKVFNKKFINETNEEIKNKLGLEHTNFYVNEYNGLDLWCRDNDHYRVGDYTCAYIHYTCGISQFINSKTVVDKRIVASEMHTMIDNRIEYNKKSIYKMKNTLENLDSYIEEFNNIQKQIDDWKNKVSGELKSELKFG